MFDFYHISGSLLDMEEHIKIPGHGASYPEDCIYSKYTALQNLAFYRKYCSFISMGSSITQELVKNAESHTPTTAPKETAF